MPNRNDEDCAKDRNGRHEQHQHSNVEIPDERVVVGQRSATHHALGQDRVGNQKQEQSDGNPNDRCARQRKLCELCAFAGGQTQSFPQRRKAAKDPPKTLRLVHKTNVLRPGEAKARRTVNSLNESYRGRKPIKGKYR